FSQTVKVDPAWLSRRDGTAGRLARAIAAEGRFGELPILADALEEAGCNSPELLTHLRGPVVHVAGCWALDLLLHEEAGGWPRRRGGRAPTRWTCSPSWTRGPASASCACSTAPAAGASGRGCTRSAETPWPSPRSTPTAWPTSASWRRCGR